MLLTSTLLLAIAAAGAYALATWHDSLMGYRSPLAKFPRSGNPGEPVVPQVVLVVVDGLREDAIAQMPALQRLSAQGASATAFVSFAQTRPAWFTLISGTEAEISDIALLDGDTPQERVALPENLFATVRHANLNTAIAAGARWRLLAQPQTLNESYFAGDSSAAVADRRATEAALGFLQNFSPNFLLLHLAYPLEAAEQNGFQSEEFRGALLHSDYLISQLRAAVNLRQSVLVVTASHGVSAAGGHGGAEPEVNQVPLVLAGAKIKPGRYDPVRQSDIAPTIAALVGGGLPNTAQGEVLFPLLELSDAQRAAKALALAQQQSAFGAGYLATIGGELSEHARNDPLVAQSSYEVKNYESTFNLAHLAAVQIGHDLGAARTARIERERLARAPAALALAAVPLAFFWFRRSLRFGATALIAFGIVAMTHLRYLQTGYAYSFSDAGSPEAFVRGFAERGLVALAFGALLVIILHWRDAKPSRVQTAVSLYYAAAIAIYLLLVPGILAYYRQGLKVEWYLGDPSVAYALVFALASATALGALAPLAGIAASLAHWLALIGAHRIARLAWIQRLRGLSGALAHLLH